MSNNLFEIDSAMNMIKEDIIRELSESVAKQNDKSYINDAVLHDGTNGLSLTTNTWKCAKPNKIILNKIEMNASDLKKYKEAYCDTNSNGLFLSFLFNDRIDGSGSIIRKDFPFLKIFNSVGLIWDPDNNAKAIECGYFTDAGTFDCEDIFGIQDRCSCYSDGPPMYDIKEVLDKDINIESTDYNEFVYLRKFNKNQQEKIKYVNLLNDLEPDKRPSALFNIINYPGGILNFTN